MITSWLLGSLTGAVAATIAWLVVGKTNRDHEPRAVKLLGPAKPPCFDRRDIGAHECMYIEVQRIGEVDKTWRCVSCGKPSSTFMPGDVQVRS